MKVDSKTAVVRPAAPAARSRAPAGADDQWIAAPLVKEVLARLPGGLPRCVARAPGRLHVIGGLSDYMGSRVVFKPAGEYVCAAVQTRDDDRISIHAVGSDGLAPTEVALETIGSTGSGLLSAERGRELAPGDNGVAALCVLGTIVEMVRANLLPTLRDGFSVGVGTTIAGGWRCGSFGAASAATATALAAALEAPLDGPKVAEICKRVENEWVRSPVGIADAVCALHGHPGAINQVQCDPYRWIGAQEFPEDVALIGIDCGVVHDDAREKHELVRAAAQMGCVLIDRIVRHENMISDWDGYVFRIPLDDYVKKIRNRIPTRMKGRDFLEHFGPTADPFTRIEPREIYKIRSRTEHHVYEHWRAGQFFDALARAADGEDGALKEAGDYMYSSHWSYGQRCGLGSIETDLLVNLLRHRKEPGIFGANVTGRGCGGTVAVLMRSTERTWNAVEAAVADYTKRTGHPATIYRDSLPGALVTGTVTV